MLSQREATRSTIEGVPQALGNWRPTLTLEGDYNKQYSHLNTRESSGSRDQRRYPHSAGVSLTQPLYRGGRTVAGVNQAEFNVLAAKATLDGKEQDTLLSAVSAFMNVVAL